MTEDIPDFLRISKEKREKAWEKFIAGRLASGQSAYDLPSMLTKKDEKVDEAVKQFKEEEEAKKKLQTHNRIAKMKASVEVKKIPPSLMGWDSRRQCIVNVKEEDERRLKEFMERNGLNPERNNEMVTTTDLVKQYNALAARHGKKPVKRFADKKTALKRIGEINSAKKAPETKAKTGSLLEQFDAREGTNREKLLKKLTDNYGSFVSLSDLLRTVYGDASEENKGAIMMVLKGVDFMIDKNKLKVKLVKDKKDGKISYGLFKT